MCNCIRAAIPSRPEGRPGSSCLTEEDAGQVVVVVPANASIISRMLDAHYDKTLRLTKTSVETVRKCIKIEGQMKTALSNVHAMIPS